MARKRKNSTFVLRQKKRKLSSKQKSTSSLPEVFEDDDLQKSLDELRNTSSSLLDDSVLLLDVSNSDEELDLPEGIASLQEQEEDVKSGDVLWIKHSANHCFWPAYVKEVSNKHLKVFYICSSGFKKGERTFKYIAKSKKVKQFCSINNPVLTQEGREYNKLLDIRQNTTGDAGNLSSFNKAVNLAETYMLDQHNHLFSTQQEVFEFFQSDGISLCHKKCVEELIAKDLPIISATVHTVMPTSSGTTNASSLQSNTVDSTSGIVVSPSLITTQDTICEIKSHGNRGKLSVKNPAGWFNSRNEKLVEFIIKGNCDEHLTSVLDGLTVSRRMCDFKSRWSDMKCTSSKILPLKTGYFVDEQQLNNVCTYLQNFIANYAIKCLNIVKQDDLLFSVLLPEASIYSIYKLFRRKWQDAEKIFLNGCQVQWRSNSELDKPLTDEERFAIKRKISSLAEDLTFPKLTF